MIDATHITTTRIRLAMDQAMTPAEAEAYRIERRNARVRVARRNGGR